MASSKRSSASAISVNNDVLGDDNSLSDFETSFSGSGPATLQCDQRGTSVLVLGQTGQGKSKLCNCLADCPDDTLFKVCNYSSSCTKGLDPRYITDAQGRQWEIIDSCGFSDTRFGDDGAIAQLTKILDTKAYKFGLSQIFFVAKGKFNEKDEEAFLLLSELFGPSVYKYTTVVITDFYDFEDPSICEAALDDLEDNVPAAKVMLEQVGRNRVFYVDMPSPDKRDTASPPRWKQKRDRTRALLTEHLQKCNERFLPAESKKHFDSFLAQVGGSKAELVLRGQVHVLQRQLQLLRDNQMKAAQKQSRDLERLKDENDRWKQEKEKLETDLQAAKKKLQKYKLPNKSDRGSKEPTGVTATAVVVDKALAEKEKNAPAAEGKKSGGCVIL